MPVPINGFEALVRKVQELEEEIAQLKQAGARRITFGTTYRIQAVGTGAGAVLQAVRIADNNTVQIAP